MENFFFFSLDNLSLYTYFPDYDRIALIVTLIDSVIQRTVKISK